VSNLYEDIRLLKEKITEQGADDIIKEIQGLSADHIMVLFPRVLGCIEILLLSCKRNKDFKALGAWDKARGKNFT
jgi:hypothetical protein